MATGLEESSALEEDGAPKATDVGLFGVELTNAWLEVSSTAHDSSSWTSVVMLVWLSALGGCSIARCEGEVGVKVLQGAEALATQSPAVNWERSTCRNVGSLSILTPWASDSGRGVTTGSRPPFSPSGYTTWHSNCKSRHTSSWQRFPLAILLGAPSIKVLR